MDAIVKVDFLLGAVILLEGWAVFWLVPLGGSPPNVGLWRFSIGPSPDGIRRQRLGRFLLPLFLLGLVLLGLFTFFVPDTNPSFTTTVFEYVVVASTPLYVVGVVSGVVAMVRAGRQRRQRVQALRQLHRQRQNMPS